MPDAPAEAVTIVAASWTPIAEPTVRTIMLIAADWPLSSGGTACRMIVGMAPNVAPSPRYMSPGHRYISNVSVCAKAIPATPRSR